MNKRVIGIIAVIRKKFPIPYSYLNQPNHGVAGYARPRGYDEW
jgi:hypothetical protein